MRKEVRDLGEQAFLDLIKSEKFRIKTKLELENDGWIYSNGEYFNENELMSIDEDILLLDKLILISYVTEVDTDDKAFKLETSDDDFLWIPMSIIEYSDFGIDPIYLDIPREEDFF